MKTTAECIQDYKKLLRLHVKLGFMVKNPDGSYDWTEKGDKIKNLTVEDIDRLGGADYLASL